MNLPKAIDFFWNFGTDSKRFGLLGLQQDGSMPIHACARLLAAIHAINSRAFNCRSYPKFKSFAKFPDLILFGRAVAMIRAIDMKTITMVYPGFQMLPKGLKRLLVESESFFFEEDTTFFRGDRQPFGSRGVDGQFTGGQRLSRSWKN